MRILLAFDKYKEALSAARACRAVAQALEADGITVFERPLTDGGEGFCSLLTDAAAGKFTQLQVEGPLGEWREVSLGWVDIHSLPQAIRNKLASHASGKQSAKLAVIGMADAAGLEQVAPAFRDPWRTTTLGVGRLLSRAVDSAADAVVIGLGGSATIDLGLGALAGLGFRFLDSEGNSCLPLPANWQSIVSIQLPAQPYLDALPSIFLACDVDNPLFGERGAGAVFGLQKGLRKADLPRWESLAHKMANLLEEAMATDTRFRDLSGAGAAGGFGYGLALALKAQIVPGFQWVADWLELKSVMESVDCVVTGEGRWDRGSLSGKGPHAVAEMAARMGKQVGVFAGAVEADAAAEMQKAYPNVSVLAITPKGLDLSQALAQTEENLLQKVRQWLR